MLVFSFISHVLSRSCHFDLLNPDDSKPPTHLGIRERGSVVPNQSSAVPISATPPDILKDTPLTNQGDSVPWSEPLPGILSGIIGRRPCSSTVRGSLFVLDPFGISGEDSVQCGLFVVLPRPPAVTPVRYAPITSRLSTPVVAASPCGSLHTASFPRNMGQVEIQRSLSMLLGFVKGICLQLAVKSGLSYTAAVVEFAPTQSDRGPADTLLDNAHRYIDIIKTAATHNANIVVFPECGLTTIKIPVVRQDIFPFLIELPEVGTNPCDLVDSHQVLQLLSCAAKHNAIYVVVNLSELAHCSVGETDCPPDGSLFYNTNIAFNKSGHIVARYRKTNLFIEPEFSIMKIPDYSWFDTDFGVRFGIFTCFDILFKEPTATLLREQNITDFVYPTAWFSELPFYSVCAVTTTQEKAQ
ncbi:hypothetical protein J6590_086319 [Homalodisca vitripennis]|nr:hypothetical protein J6590_086319 [Homalodisca vitripennis]